MDFDIGGLLSGLFGGGSTPADLTDPTDPTKLTAAGAAPNGSPVLGWLNKNAGGLSNMSTQLGAQLLQKPQQVQPMQLNMPQVARPQVQVPQYTGLLNQPVAPANPMVR